MPDLLVCSAAVVLQDVVLLCARCHDELLGDGLSSRESPSVLWMDSSCMTGCSLGCGAAYQNLSQVVIGYVGQLLAVDLGNNELSAVQDEVSV